MPQIQYPFIDIAVHPSVRGRFAAGEAIALFSQDMTQVLWANGEGAKLFGYADIYDFLDNGPDRGSVAFRQLAATSRQLGAVGDRRGLTMRINTGFVSQAVSAEVSLVEIRSGDVVVIFSAPVAANARFEAQIAAMLKGFDDPDTHMAVLDGHGAVLAASPHYDALGILPETARTLIGAIARTGDGLIKRPIASAAGYLPAALGKVSIDPPLHLLFCVETVLGRMDPPHEAASGEEQVPSAPLAETVAEVSDHPTAENEVSAFDETEIPELNVATAEDVGEAQPFAGDDAADETEAPLASSTEDEVAEESSEPESLELVADQAESASTPENGEAESLSEEIVEAGLPDEPISDMIPDADLPENLELAADEAASENEGDIEPEEHIEADTAEAALNEGEDETDLAELAALDGTSDEEVEDYASAEEPVTPVEPEEENAAEQEDTALTVADTPDDQPTELDSDIEAASSEAPAEAEAEAEPIANAEQAQPFEFRRDGRPVRFVWKLDADGRFAEVSEEFARTVGPRAGDINGMSFRDLASLFNLDPDHEIGQLLERRDTWSGRTIRWPVEGTDLTVPVDLAALPTYSRNREFDGFRGFGIIRVADAEQDPNAVGLTLSAPTLEESAVAADEDGSEIPPTADEQFDDVSAESTAPAEETPEPQDEFRGEVPALKVVSNPLAAFSDKIVQLEERRNRGRDGLTQNEQAAFREIARQLEPFGKRPNETLLPKQDEALAEEKQSSSSEATAQSEAPEEWREETQAEVASDSEATPSEEISAEAGGAVDQEQSDLAAEDVADAQAGTDLPDEDADDTKGEDTEEDFDDTPEAPGEIGLTASAADQIPLAILIHAGDRLIHANAEFKRFTGYASIEALEAAGGLDTLITRREGPKAGVYAVLGDGTETPVSARLQSVRYEGAKLLMLTLMPAEIEAPVEDMLAGDQEAAHRLAALKVEADELRSILETATDGVVVLNTDGRIRSMNRSASALFNFEDSETRGKPFAMLFAHESQKAVQDYLSGLAGHGVASVLNDGRELIGREASGGFIPLFMTMGRMPGSNSYCAVIRDITQWKRSEEELKTAKRAAETANQHKSDFLARVSHEIRTPLNAIIGFSDMIASEHFGPAGHPRYVEYANDIGRSGRHVLDIVNDLLDISKIEAGEMDLEFAAVGINDCVSEAVSLVQPQANAQRVIIRTSLSQSVPDVVADLRSIKQIAINILANAIRFTPSGGQIVVSTAYEPTGSVTLRIRDTGVGMSKGELEQAMRPFGQVSPGARKRGDGTGLGLPLTKAMTEANRAMFSIQSAPNEGTLVEISFPPQRVLAD